MPRILICDKLESSGLELLRHAGMEVDDRPGLKGADLQKALQESDACIVRSGTRITEELVANPGKLKAVVRAGAGVDNIDVPAATRQGIVVMNTPGGNTISAAEHTVALAMALARHIPAADASMKAGKWERGKFMGIQLTGKTFGIIGLGRIGREVAKRVSGLGMHALGFDPFIKPEKAAEYGINVVPSIEELLRQCDFLSVHTPLNDETKNLIGPAQFALLKPGVRLVNVARGGIYDEAALAEALHSGVVAGAAIDVFSQEPPPSDLALIRAPNLIVTPHLGASTFEAQDAVAREAAQLLIDYLTRGVVQFAVNSASVDRSELESLKHYMDLARRLGLLQAQMVQGKIHSCTLIYRGDIANRVTRMLTAAFASGLLDYQQKTVNVVNAELLAHEHGIELVEAKSPRGSAFGSLIHTEVTTDKKTYTAVGTLFGQHWLRLVQLGTHRLDTFLDGVLLILTHQDAPGLIGHIGTIFGKHQVNIGQMSVGRREPGGEAIAVLNLDHVPSDAAIAEVKQHPLISSLSVVKLPKVGGGTGW